MPHPYRRLVGALALAGLLLCAAPAAALAHAELDAATPPDGSTVEGTPDEIVLIFTEAVFEGSSLELRSAADVVVATGGPDPAGTTRMAIAPPTLQPGTYTVRWTAIASDSHVERGTVTFTVIAGPPTSTPTPTPAPSATASPSAAPSPTPEATPSPTPTATPAPSPAPTEPTTGAGDVVIPIVAALVLLGALGAYLLRRRAGGA